MRSFDLFPVLVTEYELGRDLTEKEIEVIKNKLLDLKQNEGNKHSSDTQVLDDENLVELRAFCEESIKDFCKQFFERESNLRLTQSWLNKNVTGEYHHKHCHPNSFVSGVFYVRAESEDKLYFHNQNPRSRYFLDPSRNWNKWNSPSWWLPARQGCLLVFLSDTEHSVAATSSIERISLSFNTFLDEDYGSPDSLTFLPKGK